MNLPSSHPDASSTSSPSHRSISDSNHSDPVLRLSNSVTCHHHHECYCFHPYTDAQTLDRLRSFQELEKLYETVSESSYDLSLKDIVDPSYTISGNLKATMAENDLQSHSQEASKGQVARRGRCPCFVSVKMMSLSYLIHGIGRCSRCDSTSMPSPQEKCPDRDAPCSAASSKQIESKPCSHVEKDLCKTEAYAMGKSRVHPSNECSTCASFTLFFKHHCLVCGKLYCSNCAKHHMEVVRDGEKCKDACNDWPSRKRFSRKVSNRCWPFASPYI